MRTIARHGKQTPDRRLLGSGAWLALLLAFALGAAQASAFAHRGEQHSAGPTTTCEVCAISSQPTATSVAGLPLPVEPWRRIESPAPEVGTLVERDRARPSARAPPSVELPLSA